MFDSDTALAPLKLETPELLAYQKNRPPYLLMDVAEEVVPGQRVKGYKYLPPDTWFFECHFPGDPNMPGMLQAESMVQFAALMVLTLPGNKGKVVYLTSVDKMVLKRKVLPGDTYCVEAELLSWRRGIGKCHGRGTVNGELACDMHFQFVMPDALASMTPKTQAK